MAESHKRPSKLPSLWSCSTGGLLLSIATNLNLQEADSIKGHLLVCNTKLVKTQSKKKWEEGGRDWAIAVMFFFF